MPNPHPIFIIKGFTSNDSLQLSDRGGRTYVYAGDEITWHVKQRSGVDSITLIEKTTGSADVFSIHPIRMSPTKWLGEIDQQASGRECDYSIHCIKIESTMYTIQKFL
ncbi:MAG: hypothetical protein ABJA71_11885 [Ginsengibacter sp.]